MNTHHHQFNVWWPILSLTLVCVLPSFGQATLAGEPQPENLPLPRARTHSTAKAISNSSSARGIQRELSELIERRASTRELLAFIEPIVQQGELGLLPAAPQLAWSTWHYPGWRWEQQLSATERLILAHDRGMLVAIRHTSNRQVAKIEMSASDLWAASEMRGRSRLGRSSNSAHATATSVGRFATQYPTLFPWYYYFAGPTAEVVSSSVLPPPPIDMLR